MGEEITAEELRWERSRPPFCRLDARLREAGSHKEEPLNNVLSRHVKQAADFNKALEKRQLWREREKELRAKHSDTWGILQAEGERRKRGEEAVVSSSAKRALDSLEAEGVDKEVVERVKVARKFGSVDVHAAIRQRIASQKEKRQLQLQNEQSDAWMPDRFYTEELKQKTPWLNPIEFLNELHQQQREESLTPVASESDGDSTKRKKKSKHKKGKKKKKKEKKENKQKKCKKADRG